MTNENIKVSLPAQIVKVETLADNGFKVVVVTNELLPEQAAFLFSLKGSAGWVLFAPNRLKEEDIPPEAVEVPQGEENHMASLQRTLYVYWDKCTKKSQAFNIFLREWVDKKKTEIKVFFPK